MIENDQMTPPVIQLWISRSKNNDWKDIKAYKNDKFLFQSALLSVYLPVTYVLLKS